MLANQQQTRKNSSITGRTFDSAQRKKRVMEFIHEFIQTHGFSPTHQEIGAEIGVTEVRVGHIITEFRDKGLILLVEDDRQRAAWRNIVPTPTPQEITVHDAIKKYYSMHGYPPRIDDLQSLTQLAPEAIKFSLRYLRYTKVIRWDEDRARGIYWLKDAPQIKHFHNVPSRNEDRARKLETLRAELPKPAPTNIIPMPFPCSEIHAPAIPKLSSNHVYSIVSSNIQHHTASIEDIAGSVADYAANILKVRHDDPQRADIFECAIRALIQHAAEMVGASAYLIWADESPDETKAPEIERTAKAG